ncbi:MAG: polysaccharide deacetylase family protein [Candidatus Eisenbacteria bacterium]
MTVPAFQLPVISYHHVDDAVDGMWSVPPALFREHLAAIADTGGAADPRAALESFRSGGSEPNGSEPIGTLITFDDAYRSLLDTAIPELEARGMRCLIFAITDYVGAWDSWNARSHVRSAHMSWEELEELTERGHLIGSHTRSHHALVKFDRERIKSELHGSAEALELHLGLPARDLSLAYPYGSFDDTVIGVAKKRYACGFASGNKGVRDWRAEPHAIHRITAVPEWSAAEIARRIELWTSR